MAPLNDILQSMFQHGLLTSKELVSLRKTCQELNENPVRVLRSLNISSPDEIQAFLQRAYRIPAVSEQLIDALDDSFKALIPIDIALHYGVFAVAEEDNCLHVAMEDPSDKGLIHRLEFFLEKRVVPVSATVHQIAIAIGKLYEVSPEQIRLTTVLESSRGIVAGSKKTPQQTQLVAPAQSGGLAAGVPVALNEEDSVQNLTERAMAATQSAPTQQSVPNMDFEEEGILADSQKASSALSLDDLAEAESLAKDSPPPAPAMEQSSAPQGEVDLFDELSSPEVLGGKPSAQPTPPAQAAPVELTPGDIAFFDDAPSTSTAPSTNDVFDLPDSVTPEKPAAQALQRIEPAVNTDTLDASLASGLDANLDGDLGDIALMDANLDGESAISADSFADVNIDGTDLLSEPPAAEANSDNEDLLSAAPLPSLDENQTRDEPAAQDETTAPAADTSEELEVASEIDDASLVPGLSDALSDVTDLNLDSNDIAKETLEAAEQLLQNDTDLGETLANADNLLASDEIIGDEIIDNEIVTEYHGEESLIAETSASLPQTLSPSDTKALTAAINAALVKLSMISTRAQAIEFLNKKLAPVKTHLESQNLDHFTITHRESSAELTLSEIENLKESSQLLKLLYPAIKRIEKLST